MASTHIYPTTQTRLAGELNTLVRNMSNVSAEATRLKAIFDQIAAGGDWVSLAEALGYAEASDAETAYNLLGSALVDNVRGSFYQQIISRMG